MCRRLGDCAAGVRDRRKVPTWIYQARRSRRSRSRVETESRSRAWRRRLLVRAPSQLSAIVPESRLRGPPRSRSETVHVAVHTRVVDRLRIDVQPWERGHQEDYEHLALELGSQRGEYDRDGLYPQGCDRVREEVRNRADQGWEHADGPQGRTKGLHLQGLRRRAETRGKRQLPEADWGGAVGFRMVPYQVAAASSAPVCGNVP